MKKQLPSTFLSRPPEITTSKISYEMRPMGGFNTFCRHFLFRRRRPPSSSLKRTSRNPAMLSYPFWALATCLIHSVRSGICSPSLSSGSSAIWHHAYRNFLRLQMRAEERIRVGDNREVELAFCVNGKTLGRGENCQSTYYTARLKGASYRLH